MKRTTINRIRIGEDLYDMTIDRELGVITFLEKNGGGTVPAAASGEDTLDAERIAILACDE